MGGVRSTNGGEPWRALGRADPLVALEARGRIEHLLFAAPQTTPTFGRYRIVDTLGAGGCGTVYRAHDPELDRNVAIKVVRAKTQVGQAVPRLVREAQAAALVVHPNVVEVFDVGVHGPSGDFFIAMELVEGVDLAAWLSQEERSVEEIVGMFAAAGRGLAAAHAAGLVHRDFKPSNVLIGNDGRIKVCDFGLARADPSQPSSGELASGPLDNDLTQTGTVLGTPAYMAPEQRAGKQATPASDVFAFCVALGEGLTGLRPTWTEAQSKATWPGSAPPLPEEYQRVLERGLQVDPRRRYGSMAPVLRELRPGSSGRRWVGTSLGLAGLGLAGFAATATAWWVWTPAACPDPAARIEGIWGAEQHRRLDAALADATLAALIEEKLDAYADQWVVAAKASCDTDDERTRDLVRLCLADKHRQLGALVEVLGDGEARSASTMTGAVVELGSPAACGRVGEGEAPADPERERARVPIRKELARAQVLDNVGSAQRSADAAQRALDMARQADDAQMIAASLTRMGRSQANLGQLDAAFATLRDGYWLAAEGGFEREALDASLGVASVAGHRGDYDGFDEWTRHGEALLERGVGDASHQARLAFLRGLIALRTGRNEDARAQLSAAVDLQRTVDDSPLELAHFEVAAGMAEERVSVERALDMYQAGLTSMENAVGPNHAQLVPALIRVSGAHRRLHDLDAAKEAAERALAIAKTELHDHPLQVGAALTQKGGVQLDLGEAAGAEKTFAEAMQALSAPEGPPSTAHMLATLGHGRALAALGRCDVATRELSESIELAERTRPNASDLPAARRDLAACREATDSP